MPSGLIDEEDGVGPWCDCLGDFGQMQVHRFGVAGREDQSRALSLLRADGSEDVGRGGALIPRSAWASAALGPSAGNLVLLTNARFIREPNLYFPNIDCLFARDFIALRDVLDPADRNPRQIHLDQRFLDRALPPAVAFADRRLNGLAPPLRNLAIDLASAGLQHPLVTASPGISPSLAALIATSSA